MDLDSQKAQAIKGQLKQIDARINELENESARKRCIMTIAVSATAPGLDAGEGE